MHYAFEAAIWSRSETDADERLEWHAFERWIEMVDFLLPIKFSTISKFSTCKVSGLLYELSKGFPRHFRNPLEGDLGAV